MPARRGGLPASPAVTLRQGLLAYWLLAEASGARGDLLALNPLTDNNSVLSTTGPLGRAASLVAASTQYLSHASTARLQITPSTGFTVAGWMRLNSAASSCVLVAKTSTGSSGEYQLYAQANEWVWTIKDNSSLTQTLSSNQAATGGTLVNTTTAWTWICGWYDPAGGGKVGLKVNNGTPALVAATLTPATSAQEFRIGARANSSLLLDGAACGVGIWSRVLTPIERNWLARGGRLS